MDGESLVIRLIHQTRTSTSGHSRSRLVAWGGMDKPSGLVHGNAGDYLDFD